MNLTEELKNLLLTHGAGLVGIGNLKEIGECDYGTGIAVAVPVPGNIVRDLMEAPTKEYCDLYHTLNHSLNEIVMQGEKFLQERGFAAYAQTTDRVEIRSDRRTKLPHKTVATRAGLGWIGKNGLLVTEAFGPAVRISSLLTTAPLECDGPVNESMCGECSLCVDHCPAQALYGTLWEAGMPRERIVEVEKCYQKQKEIMYEATGIETDLCGKCFAVCRYTQRYLRRNQSFIHSGHME